NADFRPYFLTASHCDVGPGNAASVVVYWNFESPVCDSLGGGVLTQNQTGATFRSSYAGSDFCLLELNDDPDPAWGVYFAGWDRSGTPPATSVAIHHPNTDEKAIAFNDNLVTTTSYLQNPVPGDQTHWRVDAWESGTTEPGSSGSALWNPEHRIVGQLHGGYASCLNTGASDWYGRLDRSWTGGGTASTRLRDWLDPGNTGASVLDGAYPAGLGSVQYESHASVDACPGTPSNGNGVWEAGEIVTLSVDVSAVLAGQTGITGVLSTTTPGITLLDDSATWPDLGPGGSATSEAPHFRLQLDPGMACGGQADFALTLSTSTTGPFVYVFGHGIGLPSLPTGLPLPIPDEGSGTLAHTFEVGDDVILTDLDVDLEIRHTWVGDAKVELKSPAGTVVTLLDRPGDPGFPSGCDDADMIVTFDDDSAVDLENHCEGASPWYVGTAAPFSPLAAFVGESTQGTWTLMVTDMASGDTGSLQSWGLVATPPISGVCTPCTAVTGTPGPLVPTPARFGLRDSRPNPFRDRTELHYAIDRPGPVTLRIYDIAGRLVTTLLDRRLPAGSGVAVWDGRDHDRHEVASGIYFLRLATSDGYADTKRIHLIR
ncbi:proprotein convertase P-domain-containing protein, partial [bacterium]|nr:proprotein convertase P-domain-containing protein [bacterium]